MPSFFLIYDGTYNEDETQMKSPLGIALPTEEKPRFSWTKIIFIDF
jgi:hypothetical protein